MESSGGKSLLQRERVDRRAAKTKAALSAPQSLNLLRAQAELAIRPGDPWQKDTGQKALAGGLGRRAFVEIGKSTAGSCRMVNQALGV